MMDTVNWFFNLWLREYRSISQYDSPWSDIMWLLIGSIPDAVVSTAKSDERRI